MRKAGLSLPVLLSSLLGVASGQGAAQVVDISGCRAIEDRLQRFDCYESLETAGPAVRQDSAVPERPPQPAPAPTIVTQPPATQAPPQPAPAPAVVNRSPPAQPAATTPPASPPAPEQSAEDFGRPQATARVMAGTDGQAELTDTIAALEDRMANMQVITLKSGQKWMQMINKRYPMRVGDEVRIYPSRWGQSYRLTVDRLASYIQVQRVE